VVVVTGAGGGVVVAYVVGEAVEEQSAPATGIGTVSVAPASVMRVVVHPQVGMEAPV
jgi:hypothetical protein